MPAIKIINEQSMPEHYSDYFYHQHFLQWGDLFRVDKIGEEIVGYIMCQTDVINEVKTALIVSVAVLSHYRGQGIGEALIRDAQIHMRYNNIQMSSLQVRVSNPAVALYKKLGYEVNMTMPHYYTDNEDAYLMTLVL